MTRYRYLGIVCAAGLIAGAADIGLARGIQAPDPPKPAPSATEEAETAVKVSPDLVNELSKEIGSTPEQAAGAAGALFGVAKARLKADEFAQVSKAVPGMDALLKAAPAAAGAVGTSGALTQMAGAAAGSAAGLAAAASAFSKLGLKPEMVAKAVPVLTSFVSKSGGASVGSLLAGALK